MSREVMDQNFTEIPRRSLEALQFHGYLSEVLLALIVDPLAAEDVAYSVRDVHETRIELNSHEGIVRAPIDVEDFANMGRDVLQRMKITISQWTMSGWFPPSKIIGSIAEWNRKFGLWCSCAVARSALQFVPSSEDSPLFAIETAEDWLLGRRDIQHVKDAVLDVRYAAEKYQNTNRVVYYAFLAASRAALVAYMSPGYAAASAMSYAQWALSDSPRTIATQDEANNRLLEIIANACLTFPM